MSKEERIEEKSGKWYSIFLNKYLIIGLFFVIWMIFFDQNSYFIHKELNEEINNLELDKKYYQEKLEKETIQINKFNKNSEEFERVAREENFLKKDNEDVFIVVEKKEKKK